MDLQDLAYDRRRAGPRWQKILYERQAFPDNYTDHTFLRGLKRNGMSGIGSLGRLVCSAVASPPSLCGILLTTRSQHPHV